MQFDYSIHYFRAFAIINIVIGHFYFPANVQTYYPWDRLFQGIFYCDSYYFFFISGYLFFYLQSMKNNSVLDFYRKKIQNLFLPFLIISLFFLFLADLIFCLMKYQLNGVHLPKGEYFFTKVIFFLLEGKISGPFWYIPFVMLIFLVSPLFLIMFRDAQKKFTILIIISLFLPFFYSRGELRGYPFFTPMFLAGMAYAKYKEVIFPVICRKIFMSAMIVLIICITSFIEYALLTNLTFEFIHIDSLFYLQKLFVICFSLPIFDKLANSRIGVLDSIAKLSFSIYFLHDFFLAQTNYVIGFFHGYPPLLLLTVALFLNLLMGIVTYCICFLLKQALGKYSKNIIGS